MKGVGRWFSVIGPKAPFPKASVSWMGASHKGAIERGAVDAGRRVVFFRVPESFTKVDIGHEKNGKIIPRDLFFFLFLKDRETFFSWEKRVRKEERKRKDTFLLRVKSS